MNYIRLHVSKDGQSHFAEAALDLNEADYRPPAPMMFVSHAFETDGLQFLRLPSGWAADSIHPPKKQFLICLNGRLEVTASDGEKRSFGPGDRVLMEDVEGKGHRTAVVGADEFLAAIVPIN
jgi:hypothetical protein